MGMLESKFTREDLDTLIAAMGDWETVGNQEFYMLNMIRQIPMPPEDHEAFEAIQQVKKHFAEREKEIKDTRSIREERAVFIKAKLMMIRQDMTVDQLFEMATTTSPAPDKVEGKKVPILDLSAESAKAPETETQKLESAEFFINDMGCSAMYQKFLEEKKDSGKSKLELVEFFINEQLKVKAHYEKFLRERAK